LGDSPPLRGRGFLGTGNRTVTGEKLNEFKGKIMKPGKGRPYKNDITYTNATPKSKIKDYGIPQKHFKKPTSGLEAVASTEAPKRRYTC
jgi:hypothetical protein